ncbi:hypothetical protein HRbin08_00751 [bacterium HR08]|nr:hypothetical protein HRbin08_00751 [bacterium HR08]
MELWLLILFAFYRFFIQFVNILDLGVGQGG